MSGSFVNEVGSPSQKFILKRFKARINKTCLPKYVTRVVGVLCVLPMPKRAGARLKRQSFKRFTDLGTEVALPLTFKFHVCL